MQLIQPQRSKYKKSTKYYVKDNILDIIDIEETLLKNRYIEKIDKSKFLYSQFLSSYNNSQKITSNIKPIINNQNFKEKLPIKDIKSSSNNSNICYVSVNNNNKDQKKLKFNEENINFEVLNKNKFDINFSKLKLEYKNGYKILFIKEYFPVEIIGSGSFGLVVHVIQIKTGQKMAVKIINKNNINQNSHFDYLNNEVKILNILNNPRIMKIYDILDNKHYFFIFMELIEGGNLKDLIIKRYLDNNNYLFRDSECALIMKGILEALNYIHKKNIIHRDIKPENILFKNKDDLSSVILCDFGLAYHLNEYEKSITGKCGTTIYMAPEILLKRNYDVLVDSFSAGIVLYIMCSGGVHPFYTKDMSSKDYINKNLSQKFQCKFSTEMPLLARNLFLKLCKFEPIFRYEIFKALNHPWITRSTKSPIPMTILEEYNKTDKIKTFQALLSSVVSLIIIKRYFNIKKKGEEEDNNNNNSYDNFGKNSTRTIHAMNKILNIEDKYFLLSAIKKKSQKLFDENRNNDDKEKEDKKILNINNNNNNNQILGLMTPVISSNTSKNSSKRVSQLLSKKDFFIKTGLYYNKKDNNEKNNNNELKLVLRTNSSKDKFNQKELKSNLSKSKKRKQIKSFEHIYINNIVLNKINKGNKEVRKVPNNNRHNSERKKENELILDLNINKSNNIPYNKIILKQHIIIESKSKNISNDIKRNNSINLSNKRINKLNQKIFNQKINLQRKDKDFNYKENNKILNFQNIFNNSKQKENNILLKDVFNKEDFEK